MSQQNHRLFPPRSERLVRAGLASGAAIVLAGCGAGQITQTDSQLPVVDGGGASADSIVVSNATLSPPDEEGQHYQPGGADVPLSMHISNSGNADDELVSVSTDTAAEATIEGDTTIIAGRDLFIVDPTLDEELEERVEQADVEEVTGQQATITLNDLEHTVRPAQSVTLTLTFAEAGNVEVLAPLAPATHEREVEVDEDTYREETDRLGSTDVDVGDPGD